MKFGAVAVALGMAAQACSGTSQVVGSAGEAAGGTASVGSGGDGGARATRTSLTGQVLAPENLMGVLGAPAATVHSRLRLAREVLRRVVERGRARERFEVRRMGGER